MCQDALTLSLGAALFVYSPGCCCCCASRCCRAFGETFRGTRILSAFRWTPERRQLDYLRYVGASDKTAKEVQMFNLAPWLVERYRLLAAKFTKKINASQCAKDSSRPLSPCLGTAGYYAYVMVLAQAVRGLITLGSLTF
jgi:ATP-binding cassette subfamily B protein